MNDRLIKLLLVDEDPIFRLGFVTALTSFPQFQVIKAENLAVALEKLSEDQPNLVVVGNSTLLPQIFRSSSEIPIFFLSSSANLPEILIAKQTGVKGYAPKKIAIEELVIAFEQVVAGEVYWDLLNNQNQSTIESKPSRRWLSRIGQSGLGQIDTSLATVNHQLRKKLTLFDAWFWQGRRRELLVARWLVNQLLPVEVIVIPEKPPIVEKDNQANSLATVSVSPNIIDADSTFTDIIQAIRDKVRNGVENTTNFSLEIDILKPKQQQYLLELVLDKFLLILQELKYQKEHISEIIILVLRDIWQTCTIDFFTKFYPRSFDLEQYQIINILLKDLADIEKNILGKIPLSAELLRYLVSEEYLMIGKKYYSHSAPETKEIAAIILENLIIQIANAVIQVILNNFTEVEFIEIALYKEQMVNSREIARFRNDLSWKYINDKYWLNPRLIFESKYQLLYLKNNTITTKIISQVSRAAELNQLQGIPWFVTIALEIRDAIAPRLRSVIGYVGKVLVYVLTEVIGRGIGLIGRGILQGVGNSLKETKYNRSEQEKGK